jgi:hypothetical protein
LDALKALIFKFNEFLLNLTEDGGQEVTQGLPIQLAMWVCLVAVLSI